MEARRVTHYNPAAYPDKDAVLIDHDLLVTMPTRWKRSAAICAALTATVALLTACKAEAGSGVVAETTAAIATPEITQSPTPSPTPAPTPSPTPKILREVPVFEHGTGRGSFGCMVVNPPIFLSEGEALDVIREVATENGLRFGGTAILDDIGIPVVGDIASRSQEAMEYKTKKGTVLLDGFDEERRIAFEYVSADDMDAWREGEIQSSVTSYFTLDVSRTLAEQMEQTTKGMTVGVFYDPVIHSSQVHSSKDTGDDYTAFRQEAMRLAKEELKKQVLDFIAWLKAEGII